MGEYRFLPISINLETVGGLASTILRRGIPLPTSRTERFTTASVDQESVELKILAGESPLSSKNIPVTAIKVGGIPKGPAGSQEIKTTLKVDRECRVRISTVVKGSNLAVPAPDKEIQLMDIITGEQIKELVERAEIESSEDLRLAENIELRNKAKSLITQIDKELSDEKTAASWSTYRQEAEKTLAALGVLLEEGDTEDIRTAFEKLKEIAAKKQSDLNALLRDLGMAGAFGGFFAPSPRAKQDSARPAEKPKHAPTEPEAKSKHITGLTQKEKRIFVVHGRDERLRIDVFSFLRSLGLHPIEWSEALSLTGSATPYVGDVLDKAFESAQAIVVMLTPDDEVRLAPVYLRPDDGLEEREYRRQPRPNVLFEAGMSFGRNPKRTIIVEIGQVKHFSDVVGRHVLKLNNSAEARHDLALRLKTAGCEIKERGSDWLAVGDFSINTPSSGG